MRLRLLAVLAAMCWNVSIAGAQQTDTVRSVPRVPPTVMTPALKDSLARKDSAAKRDSLARKDSLARRDSLTKDTSKVKPLVIWVDSDSIVTALLSRPGFRATRYQGDRVIFDAQRRDLHITGKPADVGRDQALVIGDTVIYNDSTKVMIALGDTVILHDPTQQSADVTAHGRVTYNVVSRRGAVTNVSTSVTSGAQYFVRGGDATIVGDTSSSKRNIFYIRNGIITSCDDSIPDYYFRANEVKYISKNLIVARPAVLYVAGVPVFWLPFLFQDIRGGRRSGILIPRFGVSDFVRTSSAYRRNVENMGYYFNMGDYMDALTWMDWRSDAGISEGDPGYVRYNGEFRYHWLDRFMTGRLSFSQLNEGDGATNTAFSWYHSQDFSQTSHLTSSINYVTNTTVQQSNATDPYAVLATIRSDVRYSRLVSPFSLDVGGTRTQYPGRTQVEEDYPNVSVSSPTLSPTNWLTWTPSFNFSRQSSRNNDQIGTYGYRYFIAANGQADSAKVNSSTENSSYSLNTPFSIKGFQISLNLNAQNRNNNFPITRTFIDPADTSQRFTRTYARSFVDGVDWNFGFSLPTFLNNSFRVRPDITFQNVEGGSYWVRTELSGGKFVHQSKRASTGISLSPTLFALFPGFGPFERIRHSITPSVRFSYSPAASIDTAYLRALNQNPVGFLGGLPQNQVSLSLSQVFEAKFRSDSSTRSASFVNGMENKIRLLSINASPLVYDFERAKHHRTGITSDQFGYDLATDLLPGFSFHSDYSLFQGDINSDSARFSPFRTSVSASFTLNGQSGIFAAIGRLFGHSISSSAVNIEPPQTDTLARGMSSFPAAGQYARNHQYAIPNTQGWSTSITVTSQQQRPPKGGQVLVYNPASQCSRYLALIPQTAQDTLLYNQCLALPPNPQPTSQPNDLIQGGPFVQIPSRENISAQSTFHITEHWSASWGTVYDAVSHHFASQQVTLQRDLHDWTASFSFTSSPNGNFFFSFYIANKAQPELRFPYTRSTYRQTSVP